MQVSGEEHLSRENKLQRPEVGVRQRSLENIKETSVAALTELGGEEQERRVEG